MSKTPKELAREYADRELRSHPMYINGLYDGFLAGYKAAQAIVEDELQAVQAQRVERPGLGSAEYALKSVVAKLGANENT
jgi:hypothetical protein